MHELLEQLRCSNDNQTKQLSILEAQNDIEWFKQKVWEILWDFTTFKKDWENFQHIRRVNKDQKFYTHIVKDLYFEDLETIPNERKNYIYKYLRRFLIPVIRRWALWMYNGRNEKSKRIQSQFWIQVNSLINDPIQKNSEYVKEYIDEENLWTNERFDDKINEYFGMYETILAKRIQKELRNLNNNWWNLDQQNIKNLLINIANEFSFIIKAFSDKLSVIEFEEIFLKSHKDKNIENSAEATIGICKSITSIYEDFNYQRKPYLPSNNESQDSEYEEKRKNYHQNVELEEERRYNDLLEMYKYFAPHGLDTSWNEIQFSHTKLANDIKKHFQDCFIDISDIFKHWLYSEEMDQQWLMKVSAELFRFYDNFLTLKAKDKAFSKIELSDFLIDILKKKENDDMQVADVLPQEYEYESFIELCLIWVNKQTLNKEVDLDESMRIKEDRELKISKLREKIINRKKQLNKPIVFTDIRNIALEDLDFDVFNTAGPSNRKKYYMDNVYVRNQQSEIIGHNFEPITDEQWNHTNVFNHFVKYYSNKHKSYSTKPEKIIADIQNAFWLFNKKTAVNTYDFQRDNIELEQLLVSWFRYTLAVKKYGTNYDIVHKKLNEEMYGPREVMLNQTKDIEDCNISFRNGWSENKIHNTSIWEIEDLIERHNLRFRKKPIDLQDEEEFWIKNNKEKWVKNILLKDISTLYIPTPQAWKPLEEKDIETHLNTIEEFSIRLLQRKTVDDEKYSVAREIFEQYGIKYDDLSTVAKIRKFLKFAKNILPIAVELSRKSQEEHEAMKELFSILEQEIWDEDKYLFEIWKPKDLKRIFEKLISSYSGDIREMWDLARMRYVWKTNKDCIKKASKVIETIRNNEKLNKYITQWIAEDSIGNSSERWPKKTQYRDLKLQLKNENWILIEMQFIEKNIFQWKEEWLEQSQLQEYVKKEELNAGIDIYNELERRADAEWIDKLPGFLLSMFTSEIKEYINYDRFIDWNDKTNSDYIYKLHRWSWNKKFKEIMEHIESLVYNKQWWKVISQDSLELDKFDKIAA